MSSNPNQDVIQQVFQLIDHRGYGQIGIEAIFQFCDTLKDPPDHEKVTQLYKQFDVDGSGDIDSEEFVGFLAALERLTKRHANEMIEDFTRQQYIELFDLCDEDGGGTIDKAELKTLIESLHGMLGLKSTAADVSLIMKSCASNELDFNDFYKVISKLVAGRPISQVVRAFKEAQRRKVEIKSTAVQKFLGLAKKVDPKKEVEEEQKAKAAAAMSRICLSCAKKEVEIEELRERLQQLEQAVSKSTTQQAVPEAKKVRKVDLSLESKVEDANRSVENAVGIFRVYPQSLKSAVHHTKGRRIARVAERSMGADFNALAKEISDNAEKAHRTQMQFMALFDSIFQTVQRNGEVRSKFLDALSEHWETTGGAPYAVESDGMPAMMENAAAIEANRGTLAGLAESATWVLDAVLDARSNLADMAMAGAPYSNKPQRLMECVLECENLSQEISDLYTTIMYHAQPENIAEVDCLIEEACNGTPFSVTDDDLKRMKGHTAALIGKTSKAQLERIQAGLKQTVYNIQANVGSFASRRRDRGVNTTTDPLDDSVRRTPLVKLKTKLPEKPLEAPAVIEEEMHSPPPRVHERRVEIENSARNVDRLVEKYKNSGINLPTNFGRLPSKSTDTRRHTFAFGTRKIDLVMVDDLLAVIVGGGYLLFDEFCEKYCGGETIRHKRAEHKRVDPYGDRPASSKRALVRSNHGVKLVGGSSGGRSRSRSPG